MLELYNGVKIPRIGLGAKIIPFGDAGKDELQNEYEFYLHAINSGICKLFDTSAAYGRNDEAIGMAVSDSHCRDGIKIMSKVSNSQQRD